MLDDQARFIETEDGVVGLDLRPLLAELTDELPLVPDLSDRLPENAGFIKLFDAEQLDTAQRITRVLRSVASWIWIPALALLALGIWIARDRRREVRAAAIGLIVLGFVLLAGRRLAGNYLVEELSTSADHDAVRSDVGDPDAAASRAAWTAVIIGAVGLVGVWLAGDDRGAAGPATDRAVPRRLADRLRRARGRVPRAGDVGAHRRLAATARDRRLRGAARPRDRVAPAHRGA